MINLLTCPPVVRYETRRRAAVVEGESEAWTYHFLGYSSLYPFYCFPEKVRMRLSQFVILPPWQGLGHGCTFLLFPLPPSIRRINVSSSLSPSRFHIIRTRTFHPAPTQTHHAHVAALYTAIYALTLARPEIAELTVEDPAEAFEDLRDRNDLRMLVAHPLFAAEAFGFASGGGVGPVRRGKDKGKGKGKGKSNERKIGPPVDRAWMERWRVQLKIAGVRLLLYVSSWRVWLT
jgi:histone acetyltransferase 1